MKDIELPPLPERDTAKPAEEQGVFRKFDVRRTDGSSEPGGKHHGCEYFVLDVDHDPAAHAALAAYADAIEATHPVLAADMRSRYGLARAAVEADRAQRELDGWKLVPIEPTAEMLDAGRKACSGNMYPQDMLHGPRAMMADRWYAAINAAPSLRITTPAKPAQQEPDWWRKRADEIEVTVARSGSTEAMRCFTDMRTLLQAATAHPEPPQQERKPMTDAQAVKCIEAAGFRTWTSAHFRLVRQAERRHGIRE